MRRDMDLIREMLIRIEEFPNYSPSKYVPMDFEDVDEETIIYHKELIFKAGFIEIRGNYVTLDGRSFGRENAGEIIGLTWAGQEFLALMKNDTAWNKAKEVMRKTGDMAFQVLFKFLLNVATDAAVAAIGQ